MPAHRQEPGRRSSVPPAPGAPWRPATDGPAAAAVRAGGDRERRCRGVRVGEDAGAACFPRPGPAPAASRSASFAIWPVRHIVRGVVVSRNGCAVAVRLPGARGLGFVAGAPGLRSHRWTSSATASGLGLAAGSRPWGSRRVTVASAGSGRGDGASRCWVTDVGLAARAASSGWRRRGRPCRSAGRAPSLPEPAGRPSPLSSASGTTAGSAPPPGRDLPLVERPARRRHEGTGELRRWLGGSSWRVGRSCAPRFAVAGPAGWPCRSAGVWLASTAPKEPCSRPLAASCTPVRTSRRHPRVWAQRCGGGMAVAALMRQLPSWRPGPWSRRPGSRRTAAPRCSG